jgi:hypothetical protein
VLFPCGEVAVNESKRVKGSGTVNEAIKSIRLEVFLFPFFPSTIVVVVTEQWRGADEEKFKSRNNGGTGGADEEKFKSIEVLMMCSLRLSVLTVGIILRSACLNV